MCVAVCFETCFILSSEVVGEEANSSQASFVDTVRRRAGRRRGEEGRGGGGEGEGGEGGGERRRGRR